MLVLQLVLQVVMGLCLLIFVFRAALEELPGLGQGIRYSRIVINSKFSFFSTCICLYVYVYVYVYVSK